MTQTDKQTVWNGKAHVYVDAPEINALTHNVDGSPKWKNPTDVIQRGDSVGIPITDSRTVAGKLKKLATLLTYKADIYGPNGRIYACDAPFTVQNGKLFHGTTEIDPETLRDGNGNSII